MTENDPTTDDASVDELLADDSLPTTTEGTDLGESQTEDSVVVDDTVPPPVDPASVPELDPAAVETKVTSDEDPTLLNLDPTVPSADLTEVEPLPGAPKNEFEALKDALLGTNPDIKVDEVTVNVDILEHDEETGEIFHEHTNYDTMVLNHPGGPYLTDVDNARNAVLAEYRMEASKEATRVADEEPNVTGSNDDVNLESVPAEDVDLSKGAED